MSSHLKMSTAAQNVRSGLKGKDKEFSQNIQ